MTNPSASLAPGASTAFAYVETPHPKDKDQRGCKGSLTWEAGSPPAATWRVEWNNPFGQKNTASAKLDPQNSGFESLEQSGQGDENVPITFTLSGGGGGDGPKPDPKPDPTPEPAFNPPPGAREPTLRKGDKNPDGWVEFLQQELNARGENLKIDGDFGASTLAAVIRFQKSQPGVQVDGTVGNQTWAALRGGQPEKPSTDGRKPHSFEEKGVQARWFLEKDLCLFFSDKDEAELSINSVGEQPIDKFKATVRITRPNSKPKTVEIEIGQPVSRTPDDQGNTHIIAIKNFRKDFAQGDTDDKLSAYLVEAYLPIEIGGDKTSGHIFVI
jgi:peptidoglycan hydrolase-like protein with peptidoglycan-binding domain